MRKPHLRDWSGDTGGGVITDDATPAAEAQLLQSACDHILDLATTPYVGTGLLFEGGTTGLTDRYVAVVLAPGAKHLRAYFANAFVTTNPASYTPTAVQWWTTTGGTTGNDVMAVPVQNPRDRSFPSATVTYVMAENVMSSAMQKDDTSGLSAPADRLGELAEHRAPTVEALFVKHACGCSFVVAEQSGDLETCPA